MNIYISGISGTGMGPLALMAKQAGFNVCGSDLAEGAIYDELIKAGIKVKIGPQDGDYLREMIEEEDIDWFVYTSALTDDHPELVLAQKNSIKCTKRDELTEFLIEKLGLKMIAVAGTHGKTTTTAMVIWGALKEKLPVSYIVGTTLGFAPSGAYHSGDKYFIYEADEYDRNFLKYHPWLAVIPAVSYDHPDIYPTKEDYEEAFLQFKKQSENIIENTANGIKWNNGNEAAFEAKDFNLAGEARRMDAALATTAVLEMAQEEARSKGEDILFDDVGLIKIMDEFPGVGRRFERINDGVYSDYAHHPEEIVATIDVAKDEKERLGKNGIVVVYQPHQNTRQHEVKDDYKDAFLGVDKIYWLPTYLTREDENLKVLTPDELINVLDNHEIAEVAELNDELESALRDYLDKNYLVVLMTAGPADEWFRKKFGKNNRLA
ncbi:hypothetical protein IKD82_01660 [Candidatus Saccharibacteria bacterium]|nr:hypothetical protein [Candidatus Saccharibacteria bacterium]